MNQVERRQREELLPGELALLKTCGGEIRKGDRHALEMARTSTRDATQRPLDETYPAETRRSWGTFKARERTIAVLKAMGRRMADLFKVDSAQLRRRPGR